MKKTFYIFLNSVPVLIMMGLIPVVSDDYLLSAIYAVIIVVSLIIYREQKDLTVLIFGFLIMIAAEYLFVSTGVESFNRNSLFGLMPLWLPFLWGCGFVAIKRAIKILEA